VSLPEGGAGNAPELGLSYQTHFCRSDLQRGIRDARHLGLTAAICRNSPPLTSAERHQILHPAANRGTPPLAAQPISARWRRMAPPCGGHDGITQWAWRDRSAFV